MASPNGWRPSPVCAEALAAIVNNVVSNPSVKRAASGSDRLHHPCSLWLRRPKPLAARLPRTLDVMDAIVAM